MKSRLLVIDTETGGFNPNDHALLSVAAVDSTTGDAFTAIIRPSPEWICEPQALAKNGLTFDFLEKNGRPEREVIQDLSLWMGERRFHILAGCNVGFDVLFLTAAFHRQGAAWPMGKMIDLQAAAWLANECGGIDLPIGKDGQPRLSLDHIAATLGFARSGKTHNALEDALLTLSCLNLLPSRLEMAAKKMAPTA